VVNDQADRLTIELDIGDEDVGSDGGNFGNELGEGDTASVRITSPSGYDGVSNRRAEDAVL